ncbi:MAG: DUF2497 domain-containing protein, partial [Hyphomicrobiaceae bacterium]
HADMPTPADAGPPVGMDQLPTETIAVPADQAEMDFDAAPVEVEPAGEGAANLSLDAIASSSGAQGSAHLEQTVSRLLRPMLKEWLDENMPRLIEQALRDDPPSSGTT